MIKMIQIVSLALSMFFLARYWLLCLRIKKLKRCVRLLEMDKYQGD